MPAHERLRGIRGRTLNALDTDLIPQAGTDVASAISEAQRLFDERDNNHRILVLITDGEDLQGDALEAAKEPTKKGMSIYPGWSRQPLRRRSFRFVDQIRTRGF